MMAQLVGYGGEEGVECVVYNVSYGVTQQLSQPSQQTSHETGEAFTAKHEPCYAEIDTAPAVNRKTAVVRKMSARHLQPPQQTSHKTGETDMAEHEPCYAMIDTVPAANRKAAVVRKLSARDLQYEQIQEIMYAAAVNQPEEDSPKMKEKCTDYCCCSVVCMDKIDHMTPVLHRAGEMGWKVFALTVFPLMGNKTRQFFVYSELTTIIAAVILSIIVFALGQNTVFDGNFLIQVVAIIGSFFAAVDNIFCLYTSCHVSKDCCKINGCRTERGNSQDSSNAATKITRASDEEAANISTEQRRSTRVNKAVNVVDVARTIIAELFLYPLLVCSIFQVITTEAYNFENPVDTLSFALLLICALSFGICVYFAQIVIIIRVIYCTQKTRRPPSEHTPTSNSQFDYSISRSAMRLQGYLVYHTIMQMLLQVFMMLAIAARFRYDNKSVLGSGNTFVSGPLWFMMVGGYVLPTCGFLTFFIVTFQWVQEFPVGLCIDMITVLQLSKADPAESSQATCNSAKSREKMEKIRTYFKINELKEKFRAICNSSFDKLLYPFLSPTMVILCIVFTGLHIVLVLSIPGEDLLFPGSERVIFACFSTIANAFTFTVATIWIIIIIATVCLLPVLLGVAVVAYAVYVGVVIIGVYFGCLT